MDTTADPVEATPPFSRPLRRFLAAPRNTTQARGINKIAGCVNERHLTCETCGWNGTHL